jgi:hypothetical protein
MIQPTESDELVTQNMERVIQTASELAFCVIDANHLLTVT